MKTGLIKYEWLEDNTIIDYNRKTIIMTEDKFDGFIYFLEELDITPKMSLVDIANDIFDYNDYFIKVIEDDDRNRYYHYNVCGELVRYVAPNGDYYDRYEINPELMTNITELKNLIY
jgi:hypothetical protein